MCVWIYTRTCARVRATDRYIDILRDSTSVCARGLFYFRFIGFFSISSSVLPVVLFTTAIHISWNQFKRSKGIKSSRWPPADSFLFLCSTSTITLSEATTETLKSLRCVCVCVCVFGYVCLYVETMSVAYFLSTKLHSAV